MRLVRVPRRLHEQGECPLRHLSLDASVDGEPCLLDQLASPEPELPASGAEQQLALEMSDDAFSRWLEGATPEELERCQP